MSTITPKTFESPEFSLKPGVLIGGKVCDTAVVRILTRGDQAAIQKEPEEKRPNAELLRSIVRLGDVTDRNLILTALNALATTDEVRIRVAIAKLEAEALTDPPSEDAELRVARTQPFDICSDPFELKPGIFVNGSWHTTTVVRLLRRGEVNQIEREPDELKRDDLSLMYSLVQIGDINNVKQEHIDLLVGGDVKRIEAKMMELRAQNAPRTKSCQECGSIIPAGPDEGEDEILHQAGDLNGGRAGRN